MDLLLTVIEQDGTTSEIELLKVDKESYQIILRQEKEMVDLGYSIGFKFWNLEEDKMHSFYGAVLI